MKEGRKARGVFLASMDTQIANSLQFYLGLFPFFFLRAHSSSSCNFHHHHHVAHLG